MYRNDETYNALFQQVRAAFLMNDGDSLPPNVFVLNAPIIDERLCLPLDPGNLSPATRHKHPSQWNSEHNGFQEAWEARMRKSWLEKVSAWRLFLKETFQDFGSKPRACFAALIELPEEPTSDGKLEKTFHETQSVKGAVREACVRSQIISQMLHPVKQETDRKTGSYILPAAEKGRVQNAVQEIVTRQIGALYGVPKEVYLGVGVPDPLAGQLDVIGFCLKTTKSGVNYALAVRLRASGEIDVLLPEKEARWRPYSEAAATIGCLFAEARKDIVRDEVQEGSPIRLSQACLSQFVERTLMEQLERPTLAVIEAESWRQGWSQLLNPKLAKTMGQLMFGQWSGGQYIYDRDDPCAGNLVGVLRLRTGEEAPHYITSRETWQRDDSAAPSRDLFQLSGFVDQTTRDVFHYFSVGRLPDTVKQPQSIKGKRDPYKIEDGGGIAFKHQQMVEIVPFFVRSEFQSEEGLKMLCRIPHYLRSSPAWTMGNITLPYPMHLGEKLIEDQLCILGFSASL